MGRKYAQHTELRGQKRGTCVSHRSHGATVARLARYTLVIPLEQEPRNAIIPRTRVHRPNVQRQRSTCLPTCAAFLDQFGPISLCRRSDKFQPKRLKPLFPVQSKKLFPVYLRPSPNSVINVSLSSLQNPLSPLVIDLYGSGRGPGWPWGHHPLERTRAPQGRSHGS